MNSSQGLAIFSPLPDEEKIEFLIRLAHELTIVARDTYEAGTTGVINHSRLRNINEVQHRITGQIHHLLKKESRRYPDDVFIKIILEHPDDSGLQQQIQAAFSRLAKQIPTPAQNP